ncbi:MAG: Crp/Fnr family transcriptional regulator [Breznakibacter sp.]
MNPIDNFPIDKFTSKSDSILKDIPAELRQQLEGYMVDKVYRKGQNLFVEGLYPSGIYFLKEGLVKKIKTDHTGREHILYLCTSGEILGYSALLCHEPLPDSAMAIEDTKIGFIHKELFLKVLAESPVLMRTLLSSLSHEFGVMVNSVTVFANMTVRERLAYTLLILSEKFKRKSPGSSGEIVLLREDLANMVGTATETVVRLLQEMKRSGTIEMNGKSISVVKTKELVELSKFY